MLNKLNVLITNDDGIFGEGLSVLANTLKDVSNVYVLAPQNNCSGVSSHITMDRSLTFIQIQENVFCCNGFPADCVLTALNSKLFSDVKFDCVLSGINQGANIGTDCIYSGTIAAARQAVLHDVPGIALSLTPSPDDFDYNYFPLAKFVKNNLEKLISLYKKNRIISVNAISASVYKGVKFSDFCVRDYNDEVIIKKTGKNTFHSTFASGVTKTEGPENNEHENVCNEYISISSIFAESVYDKIIDDVEFKL